MSGVKKWIFKRLRWKERPFFRKGMPLLFNRPLGLEGRVARARAAARKAGLKLSDEFPIIVRNKNPFWGEVLIAIERPKKQRDDVVLLSGTFVTEYFVEPLVLRRAIAIFAGELSLRDMRVEEFLTCYPKGVEQGDVLLLARIASK